MMEGSIIKKEAGKKQNFPLNSTDTIFHEIRNLHFSLLGGYVGQKAKEIKLFEDVLSFLLFSFLMSSPPFPLPFPSLFSFLLLPPPLEFIHFPLPFHVFPAFISTLRVPNGNETNCGGLRIETT